MIIKLLLNNIGKTASKHVLLNGGMHRSFISTVKKVEKEERVFLSKETCLEVD